MVGGSEASVEETYKNVCNKVMPKPPFDLVEYKTIIDVKDMCPRLVSILETLDIKTWEQLLLYGRKKFKATQGVGTKTLNEIQYFMPEPEAGLREKWMRT